MFKLKPKSIARPLHTRSEDGDNLKVGVLPAFCDLQVVVATLMIAELIALVLVVAPGRPFNDEMLIDFGMISLFNLWVTLLTSITLCTLQKYVRLNENHAGKVFMFIIVAYTVLLTWLVQFAYAEHDNIDLLRNATIAFLVSFAGARHFYLQHVWKQSLKAQAKSKYDALQARIRPHFLFNSLNGIASMVHIDADKAESAVLDLSDLFRAAIEQEAMIPLSKELELCRLYINLQQLRLGDRVQVDFNIVEGVDDILVPSLFLQPLVENAIHHGVEHIKGGGEIKISVADEGDRVRLIIANPVAVTKVKPKSKGTGIALDNAKQRLNLMYGDYAKMAAGSRGHDYVVEIMMPKVRA